MIKWLKYHLGICNHTWEEKEVMNKVKDNDGKKRIIGKVYLLRCTKCGNLKNHSVGVYYD